MELVNWLLKKLPFDGSKLKIGVALALAAALQKAYPDVDWTGIVHILVAQNLDLIALLAIITGSLSKVLKAKYDKGGNTSQEY